jgi:hypothetical protein
VTTLAQLTIPAWPDDIPPLDRDGADGLSVIQKVWQEDGAVIIRDFVPPDLIRHYCEEWLEHNGNGRLGGWPHATPYREHPELLHLCCYSGIQGVLQELMGEPMGVHLNLTGWRSTQRNWHQDGYLNPDEARDFYVAVWIALDDIDPDAGPFQYIPGSHRELGLITNEKMMAQLTPEEHGPDWPTHSERILTPLFEQEIADRGWEIAEFHARKGDVLFWHPRLLHRGSVPRNPLLERRALIAHYSGINHRPDFPKATHVWGGWQFPIVNDASRTNQ